MGSCSWRNMLLCVVTYLNLLQAEKHSLYYIYTALSKPVNLPGIYEFTAMGLLDDRQIDFYNSNEQRKFPKQYWMKEKMQEDYWEKGTQSRKSKEQWFNVNIDILMKRMGHSESDLHVLQWRTGCEVERQGDEMKFSKGISEYAYDGENFLSFDDIDSQWVAPVDAALPTKRKWDNVPILNLYTKGYLEKECVDWLNKFREYADEELRNTVSPPDVYMFVKRSTSDKAKLKLTCLATGFHPKDMLLTIRKSRTSLPEDEIESTGVRPNYDDTFQLRKSVEIKEDEKAEYDCFVTHRTLKEPVIVIWDGKCCDCLPNTVINGLVGAVIGAMTVIEVFALMVCILLKKHYIDFNRTKPKSSDSGKFSLEKDFNRTKPKRSDSGKFSLEKAVNQTKPKRSDSGKFSLDKAFNRTKPKRSDSGKFSLEKACNLTNSQMSDSGKFSVEKVLIALNHTDSQTSDSGRCSSEEAFNHTDSQTSDSGRCSSEEGQDSSSTSSQENISQVCEDVSGSRPTAETTEAQSLL